MQRITEIRLTLLVTAVMLASVARIALAAAADLPSDDPADVALLKDKLGQGCVVIDSNGNLTDLSVTPEDIQRSSQLRHAISRLHHIRYVGAKGNKGIDALLSAISSWSMVESVDLSGDVTDDGLAKIAGARKLRQVGLTTDLLTDAAFLHLGKLERLNYLCISCTSPNKRLKITGKGMKELSRLSQLEELEVLDCAIDDSSLASLSGLNLKRLELRHPAISDRGIDAISKITGIESLVISDAAITDKAFASIGTLTNLRVLSLVDCSNVTGKDLARLRGNNSLRFLCLQGCPIDDAAVQSIGPLPLGSLNLRRTKITDRSVGVIAKMATLDALYVSDTQLSKAAIQRLKNVGTMRVDE